MKYSCEGPRNLPGITGTMKVLVLCLLMASLAFGLEDVETVEERYNSSEARTARENHFFCINRYTENEEGETVVKFDEFEQIGAYVWTLFFQFPLLSYLDVARKRALIDIVVTVLNLRGVDLDTNTPMDLDDVCIGTYEVNWLTSFDESVLIHIYGRRLPFMAGIISEEFNERIQDAYDNPDNNYVVGYPDQTDRIALNLSASYEFTNILHPGGESSDGVDPTQYAVFIGSYGFNVSFEESDDASVSVQFGGDYTYSRSNFVRNPNPINYGLEPGDIVFAFFGSVLLAALSFLIILGYCIHPFFLA